MKRLLLFLAATQLSFGAMDLPFQEIYDEVAREVNDLARAWVKPEYQPLIEMSQAQNSNYMNAHTFEFWFHFKNTQGVRETKYLGSFTGETIAQIHNGDIPAMVRHLITAVFFGKRGVRDLLRLKPEMQSPNHPKMGNAPRPKPLFREPVDPAEIEKHLGPYTEHGGVYYRAETYSGIVRWLEKKLGISMRAEKIRSMWDYELAKLRKKGMDVVYADEVSLKLGQDKAIKLIVPFHSEDPDGKDGGFTVKNAVIARFQEALSVLVQESPILAEKLGLESHQKPVLVGAIKKSPSRTRSSVSVDARDACCAIIGSLVKNPAFLEAWPNN